MDERNYWLAFSVCPGIGSARFEKLLTYFGSAEKAWKSDLTDLITSGIGQKVAEEVHVFRKRFNTEQYEERMQKLRVSYLTLQDQAYPTLLKTGNHPPFVLYTKGTFSFNSYAVEKPVAVVGTRRVTEYGKQVTQMLVSDLVASGCVIVSGLAMGVDAVAHAATLDTGGQTIAVLGSGVDYCTPSENKALYDRILANGGAIISETPLGQMPHKGSFPMRNRIIAGLSLGVLVTEGAQDSGSLITANDAFSLQRPVFAVPGPITSSVSQGPIALINKGAKMVTKAEDIMQELGIILVTNKKIRKGDTKEEQVILDLLEEQQLHFDEIVKKSGLESAEVGTLLSLMEMKGMIRNLDSGMFGIV